MVKRMQHIGPFLHNEMGISMGGISPMCGRSSIQLQKIFFLRSIFLPNPRQCKISHAWGRLTDRHTLYMQGGTVRMRYTPAGRQAKAENLSI
jgi:hypothetical protein